MNESNERWWMIIAQIGRILFAFALIGIGLETLVCPHLLGHSSDLHGKIVPVIPWEPALPLLAYSIGIIFTLGGIGMLVRRTLVASAMVVGCVMMIGGLAFDLPRHPDVMSAPWRTNLLEPIVIGCLAWLGLAAGEVPRWLQGASRYLIAFALIVFGLAHFQILTYIANLVPGWIPWPRFWSLFCGVAFIAAGLSFASGYFERWSALAIGTMFGIFLLTIHLPPVLKYLVTPSQKQDPDLWAGVFIVTALGGGFWALLAIRPPQSGAAAAAHLPC